MRKLLTLLLLFSVLGIGGCFSLHDDDWGYWGGSEGYEEGSHRNNSEHDD